MVEHKVFTMIGVIAPATAQAQTFPIMSESVIMEDVIPFVDATFRTIPSRNGRAIEGFSMGGRGAIKLAFNHPDQFCSAIAYAGAAYESIPSSATGTPTLAPTKMPTKFRSSPPAMPPTFRPTGCKYGW